MRISAHVFACAFVAAAASIVLASPAFSQAACKGLHRSVEGVLTAVNQSIATGKTELAAAKATKSAGPSNPQLWPQGSLDTMNAAVVKINELKGQLNDPEVSYASAIAVFSYMQAVIELLQTARQRTTIAAGDVHIKESRGTDVAINGAIAKAEAVAIQGARCYIDAYVPA